MGNNDNNHLILGLASPSNIEPSENQMNGHSGPNQIAEGEKSNNFEKQNINPISNIIENEEENLQVSQNEDLQPSSSNEKNMHKNSFCRCSAIIKDKIENIEVPIRQYLQELDNCYDCKHKLLPLLDSGLILPHEKQLIISKLLCDKMIHLWGDNYPPHCLKVKVGKLLIQEFPSLKSTNFKHAEGHEHFSYGMFLNYLKYKAKGIDPARKKNRPRRTVLLPIDNQPDLTEEDLYEMKVENVRLMKPDETNKKVILELMVETRPMRLNSLDSLTLNTVLNRFPRFFDYKGLVKQEFASLYKDKQLNIEEIFPKEYTKLILEYTKKHFCDMLDNVANLSDDNLKAISLIPFLLDQQNENCEKKRGRKRKLPENYEIPSKDLVRYLTSADLGNNIFRSNWESLSPQTLKDFMIIFQRTRKPIILSSGYIISLSNTAFTSIVKTSYSVFNVLNV